MSIHQEQPGSFPGSNRNKRNKLTNAGTVPENVGGPAGVNRAPPLNGENSAILLTRGGARAPTNLVSTSYQLSEGNKVEDLPPVPTQQCAGTPSGLTAVQLSSVPCPPANLEDTSGLTAKPCKFESFDGDQSNKHDVCRGVDDGLLWTLREEIMCRHVIDTRRACDEVVLDLDLIN